jgi:hypothetical protein
VRNTDDSLPAVTLMDQSSLREIPRRAAFVDTLMVPVSERDNDGRKRIDISGPKHSRSIVDSEYH